MTLSAFIKSNLEAIVAEWESFARSLDPTRQMSRLALQDHCREILRAVAEDMERVESVRQRVAKSKGLAPPLDEAESAASSHGTLRHVAGFDLVELFAEFRALRASVLLLWQRSIGAEPSPQAFGESIRFNEAIDQALAESVASYSANVDGSRDMFLAILGHDLRGPLAGIRASSALLDRPGLPEASRQKAQTHIKRASREMHGLITDLLEYTRSRLGTGIPVERILCDLGPVCEQAIESIRASHPERPFLFEALGELGIAADGARLTQVLSNLLNNAVQHGDPDMPVSLRVEGLPDAIVIEVRNAGRAIPPEALGAIFEPLIQAPGADESEPDERSKTSLGLGLFIVREIVQGHAGTVTVRSSEEAGTVFAVRLPRPVSVPSLALQD